MLSHKIHCNFLITNKNENKKITRSFLITLFYGTLISLPYLSLIKINKHSYIDYNFSVSDVWMHIKRLVDPPKTFKPLKIKKFNLMIYIGVGEN
jgi:hypothetical protein